MRLRRFAKVLLLAAGLCVAGRTAYFAFWERYDLRVTQWDVPLPRWPEDLDGLRIAHLSDLHLEPALPDRYVSRVLELLNHVDADAIVFTGDLLSTDAAFAERYRQRFADVHAPLGKYAVLGNHDFVQDRSEPITRFLRETGWTVLRNESVPLPGTARRVWLLGIEDPTTGVADLEKALAGVPPEAVRVLLSHPPDYIDVASAVGLDLVLAGHTHGGQVVVPLLGPVIVPSKYGAKYAWGLFDMDGTRMEVTRGVGMVRPRVRFNCPPEIAVLQLRRGDVKLSKGLPERDFRPHIRRLRNQLRRLKSLVK
jgi:predicted MPP superfamily phosphohydrolase